MNYIFFCILLLLAFNASSLSVGSCAKFSADGQSCVQCISNYHLSQGECYVDILGCTVYKFGNICHQCDKNYILVNNLCCDMVCMSKMFSKFKKQTKKETISNNAEILSELIPFAQQKFIQNSAARLVAIEVKQFKQARRYFFLYQYFSTFASRRLVLDYVFSSKTIVPVDWSETKNSWRYAVIEWAQVQNDVSVLAYFPSIYPSGISYDEVIVRKAIVNKIEMFQVATRKGSLADLKILYTSPTGVIIISQISKNLPPNSSIMNSNLPTNIVNPTKPGQIITIDTIKQFKPYEKIFKGPFIVESVQANKPLQSSIQLIAKDPKFNHTVTLVTETMKIKNTVEYYVVGQNRKTGSILRYYVQYNPTTKQSKIVNVYEEIVNFTTKQFTDYEKSITSQSNIDIDKVVEMTQNKLFIAEDGPNTHSHYMAPLNQQMKQLTNKLNIVYDKAILDSQRTSNPITKRTGLVFRRLVVTENGQGVNWREIAVVSVDPSTPRTQYFVYFLEQISPKRTWFFMGTNTKNQTAPIYASPFAYPIELSDPSYVVGPKANLYQQPGMPEQFLRSLSPTNRNLYRNVKVIDNTQVDRIWDLASRFSFDYQKTDVQKRYKAIGIKIKTNRPAPFLSHITEQTKVDYNFVPVNPNRPSGPGFVTQITSNKLGQQTVTTNNVESLMKQDKILFEITKVVKQNIKTITKQTIHEVIISEFSESLEYTLVYQQQNVQNKPNFRPSQKNIVTIIHNKKTHENKIITSQVIKPEINPIMKPVGPNDPNYNPLKPSSKPVQSLNPLDGNFKPIDYVPKGQQNKLPKTTKQINSKPGSYVSIGTGQNGVDMLIPNNQYVMISKTQLNKKVEQIKSSSTNMNVDNNINKVPRDPKQQAQLRRVKQLIESAILQLQTQYNINVPQTVQITQQIDTITKIVKFGFIFSETNTSKYVSVTSMGDLTSQNNPTIVDIKSITKQVAQTLTKPALLQPINPITNKPFLIEDPKRPNRVDIKDQTNTQTKPFPFNPSKPLNPSEFIITQVQNKLLDQTQKTDGQIRKIEINPDVSKLSKHIQKIVSLVTAKQKTIYTNNNIQQQPIQTKVYGVQIASSTVDINYAITMKTIYKNYETIRTHFYLKTLQDEKNIYLGNKQLQPKVDLTNTQTRAFTNFKPTPVLITKPSNNINTASTQSTTTNLQLTEQNKVIVDRTTKLISKKIQKIVNVNNVLKFETRQFPDGQQSKIVIITEDQVVLAHILTIGQQTNILKWQTSPKPVDNRKPQSTSNSNQINTKPGQLAPKPYNPSDPSDPINEIIKNLTKQQLPKPGSLNTVISIQTQQKLNNVLDYLSLNYKNILNDATLQQYASNPNKNTKNILQSTKFDLYFTKYVTDKIVKQFFITIFKYQNGTIAVPEFRQNQINLSQVQNKLPQNLLTSGKKDPIKQQQQKANNNLISVDPNQVFYIPAMELINKDQTKQPFDIILDFNKQIPSQVSEIVKFLRVKYPNIYNSRILSIIQSFKSTTLQKYRIYFFKELIINNRPSYQVYRTIVDYAKDTPQIKINVYSFELYINNNQIVNNVKDLSLQDDTDIAYGYILVSLDTISQDKNIQAVLRHINQKYKDISSNSKLNKIEQLRLLDGRINYKILYKDTQSSSQFKFIIFYQPSLQKVLVLNSVNVYKQSQYNQLSNDEQQLDKTLSLVLSYINSIHPQVSGFNVVSVSKSVQLNLTEYSIIIQKSNKRYKSISKVSSNNADITQIKFSEMMEISLDHYRLDQYDQMFIMNYQKLSQDQLRTSTKFRMVLSELYAKQNLNSAQLLGAASKPSGLGFDFKIYLKNQITSQLSVADIYIESFSNKVIIRNYQILDFESNLNTIAVHEPSVIKIINYLKKNTPFVLFTARSASIKDFLYGTLYKLTIFTGVLTDVYLYHDHSTEEVLVTFYKGSSVNATCIYDVVTGSTCVSCKSQANYRVYQNTCIANIQNCVTYNPTSGDKCLECSSNSVLVNGICIQKTNCGAICQSVSL